MGSRRKFAQLRNIDVVDPVCVECGGMGKMTSGRVLYPHQPDRFGKIYYRCDCGAAVGCHPGTGIPVGRPACAATRRLRHLAHEAFDAIWRRSFGTGSALATGTARKKAYRWLARELGLALTETHIGRFDAATCHRVIELCAIRNPVRAA